jgi:ADP-ribose pyrophosphatase YjhB (NUDIX family)
VAIAHSSEVEGTIRRVSGWRWVEWARQLQAIAQTGVAYDAHPYHADRYAQVRRIAAEIAAAGAGEQPERLEALFALEIGHATPKLDVRGAAFRGDELLLVCERSSGGWTLPGGWADVGDSPAGSTVREVREESGYAVRATKLIALHDRERRGYRPHPWYTHKATFLCELLDEEPAEPDHEVTSVGFFAEDAIPALDVNRTAPDLVTLCFAHLREPNLPTDFD